MRKRSLSGPITLVAIVCIAAVLLFGIGSYIGAGIYWKVDAPFISMFTDLTAIEPDWSHADCIAEQWLDAVYYVPATPPIAPELAPEPDKSSASEKTPADRIIALFGDIDAKSFKAFAKKYPDLSSDDPRRLNIPIGTSDVAELKTKQGDSVLAIYGSQSILVVKRELSGTEIIAALDYSGTAAGLSLSRSRTVWETLEEHQEHSDALILLGANDYIYNETRKYGTVIGGITAHGVPVYRTADVSLMTGFDTNGTFISGEIAASAAAYNTVQSSLALPLELADITDRSDQLSDTDDSNSDDSERKSRGGVAVCENGTVILFASGGKGGGVTVAELCAMLKEYGATSAVQTLSGERMGMRIGDVYPLTDSYGNPQRGTLAFAAWSMGSLSATGELPQPVAETNVSAEQNGDEIPEAIPEANPKPKPSESPSGVPETTEKTPSLEELLAS